jgi:carbon starvation protein CstA
VIGLLLFEEMNNKGFDYLWRYFAWANQTVAVFSFSVATIYMIRKKMLFFIPLIPGTFYFYIVVSFILNAQIGLNIPWLYAYIVAGVLSVSYVIGIIFYGYKSQRLQKTLVEEKAIYKFKSLKN